MTNNDQVKIGEILVGEGIITKKQLAEFLKESEATGQTIVEIVSGHGIATEDDITRSLSTRVGCAYVDMSTAIVEPKAVELVPEDVCSRLSVIPLYIVHDILTLAMANPLDVGAMDEIKRITNLKVRCAFASSGAVRNAINKYYHGVPDSRLPEKPLQPTEPAKASTDQVASLKQAASLAPVVDMVDKIIAKAVEMSASDIHLEPQRNELNCRYRIDGILHSISRIPIESQAAVISRIKIMANMDIAEKRLPQDGRVRMFAAQREVDLRISTFPTIYGENLVIRILDRSTGVLKLSQIGFSKDTLKAFSELIQRPYGIILVTGPTGSGKTTTLYGALSEINSSEKNIITLEDPVEYEIANVRQSQVNVKAGLTFASGLRSIVRQDPDIIMIGEIRDKETADIAIHAALTGHLVFSTLHTNDAPSAITRLVDMGVEPFLVSSSIIGILAQRLVRNLCNTCKEEYTPPKELVKTVIARSAEGAMKQSQVFYKEKSCKRCKERGYVGRSGIFELLIPNDKIKDLIAKKATAADLREEAVKAGMQTLRDSGIEKLLAGTTSVAELLRVTEEV